MAEQHVNATKLRVGILSGVTKQHAVATGFRGALNAVYELREK